jgi:hypothetical protein
MNGQYRVHTHQLLTEGMRKLLATVQLLHSSVKYFCGKFPLVRLLSMYPFITSQPLLLYCVMQVLWRTQHERPSAIQNLLSLVVS